MSNIRFASPEHRDFFLRMMGEARKNDCYHRAFFYVMGIAPETRANIRQMFDFKQDCIDPDGMHGGWQTSGTVRVIFLRREPEPAKPPHRKLPLMPLPLIIPKSRNMGTFQRKKSVISVKKQFARDTKICLQLTLTVKLPRRKRKRKPKLRKQKKM